MTEYTPTHDRIDKTIERLEYERRIKSAMTEEELNAIRSDLTKIMESADTQLEKIAIELRRLQDSDLYGAKAALDKLRWENENLAVAKRNLEQENAILRKKLVAANSQCVNLDMDIKKVRAAAKDEIEKYKSRAERYLAEYDEFRKGLLSQKSASKTVGKTVVIKRGRERKRPNTQKERPV